MSSREPGADIKTAVRERYAGLAELANRAEAPVGCGGASGVCCGPSEKDFVSTGLYAPEDLASIPRAAELASLGCGNPTALAELRPAETVLDLGSGGGIDVLLSARRVGPAGKVYGLDMTDEMLALAERNRAAAGLTNIEFLKGDIEAIPLPAGSVDVIISNCVINLAADKDRVLAEAFRVLKPGGRFAVSDVVSYGVIPEHLRRRIEAWVGCIAGALTDVAYRAKLEVAGFADISLERTRTYSTDDVPAGEWDLSPAELASLDGKFAATFIRARKPA